MTIPYDPFNWYWVVAGSSTQVYSSAADNYVLVSDTTYTAWLAAGGAPTQIASEAELGAVLAQTFQAPTPAGILTGYNNALAIFTNTPALSVQANTASSSTSTGALVVVGGAGVGGALNVSGTLIAGNIPASGGGTTNFLRADGTWAAPPAGGAGQALTKTDDTNVTLTLGGSPTVALVTAASLTLGWTGTLSNARGGTGTGTYTLGDILYSSATNVLSKLAGNTTATKNFLSQTGTGTVSAAPAWGTIATTDLTGSAALTAVNDTNVTLTLGGTPATALLRAASVTAGWTGTLAVSRGGSGAGTFTANGILYGSGTSAFGVTAQGAAGQLMLGQGAAAPAWATMGTDATITSAGALTIANSAVTFAKMQNSAAAGLSVIGRSANTAGVFAEISAASDAQVFRRSGTAVGFGAIDISSANAVVNRLAYANLAQGSARSVLGVTGNATADVASIQGTADQVLVVNTGGTALAFGTVATAGITNAAVTYAKIQNVSVTSRFIGRITAGAGSMEELTGTQATTLLDVFTGALKGLVPSGGTSSLFLRGDGTWQASGGAPTNSSYVTIASDATLTAERTLTAGSGITLTDGGANSTATIAVNTAASFTWSGAHTFSGITINTPASGVTTAFIGTVGTAGRAILTVDYLGAGNIYIDFATIAFRTNAASAVQFAYLDSSALNLQQTTASTSTTTGALIVSGGVGVAGALNVGTYITAAAAPGFWVAGKATAVNFNSANTDTSIPITLPSGYTRYRVTLCFVSHASISLTTATCGLFTAAGGTGTTVVALATTGITSTAENTNNNGNALTVVGAATMTLNASTLFFRIGTAQGAAATADVTIYVTPLP